MKFSQLNVPTTPAPAQAGQYGSPDGLNLSGPAFDSLRSDLVETYGIQWYSGFQVVSRRSNGQREQDAYLSYSDYRRNQFLWPVPVEIEATFAMVGQLVDANPWRNAFIVNLMFRALKTREDELSFFKYIVGPGFNAAAVDPRLTQFD